MKTLLTLYVIFAVIILNLRNYALRKLDDDSKESELVGYAKQYINTYKRMFTKIREQKNKTKGTQPQESSQDPHIS